MEIKLLACVAAFVVGAHAGIAATGYRMDGIVLYQPDHVLEARLSDRATFVNYIRALDRVCVDFFVDEVRPETLHVVIALKPGRQSRVWFVSSTRADVKALAGLREKLEEVPAIEVFGGPVAFAIVGAIAGGDGKPLADDKDFHPPVPKEWRDAVKDVPGVVEVPDGYVRAVWPDTPGLTTPGDALAPPGFVNQILEPLGGRILRPKDWYYAEAHEGPTYRWTISKEDMSKRGGYTTGARIQMFVGVKEHTGATAKEFITSIMEQRRREAQRVIDGCKPQDMGLFTRICLETEEGPHHILYSLYWGRNELDIAVVAMFGTTKELWNTYSSTWTKMNHFELIDMARFDKK